VRWPAITRGFARRGRLETDSLASLDLDRFCRARIDPIAGLGLVHSERDDAEQDGFSGLWQDADDRFK